MWALDYNYSSKWVQRYRCTCYSLTLKSGPSWGPFWPKARTLMTFFNDPTFYRVVTASSTYPRSVHDFMSL